MLVNVVPHFTHLVSLGWRGRGEDLQIGHPDILDPTFRLSVRQTFPITRPPLLPAPWRVDKHEVDVLLVRLGNLIELFRRFSKRGEDG